MKKLLIIVITIVAIIFLYNRGKTGKNEGIMINGYKGTVASVQGNVITLTSGVRVQLLGVKPDRIDVELFVRSNYLDKPVTLWADSQSDQEIPYSDDIVRAYVVVDETASCLNHLAVSEYPEAYSPIEITDSTGWVANDIHPAKKNNLALYMKQRTFLLTTDKGLGTGFFINENGLAITNWHVMNPEQEKQSMAILYKDNPDDSQVYRDKKRNIKNVLWSQNTNGLDITIFSVDLENGEKVPYFNLAKRSTTMGGACATFGNPDGLTASYSTGVISAYRPDSKRGVRLMQYTMSTNGGNSGGPVCDEYGRVIAVHELGRKDLQNVNFGIDILQVRDVLNGLSINYGGK